MLRPIRARTFSIALLLAFGCQTQGKSRPEARESKGEPTARRAKDASNGSFVAGDATLDAQMPSASSHGAPPALVVRSHYAPSLLSEILIVDIAGNVIFVGPADNDYVSPKYHRREWTLSAAAQKQLEEAILRAKVTSLASDYDNPAVHDGVFRVFLFGHGDGQKAIRCRNQFPQALRELEAFIEESVLEGRTQGQSLMLHGKPVTYDDLQALHDAHPASRSEEVEAKSGEP